MNENCCRYKNQKWIKIQRFSFSYEVFIFNLVANIWSTHEKWSIILSCAWVVKIVSKTRTKCVKPMNASDKLATVFDNDVKLYSLSKIISAAKFKMVPMTRNSAYIRSKCLCWTFFQDVQSPKIMKNTINLLIFLKNIILRRPCA